MEPADLAGDSGVSQSLARERARTLRAVRYALAFTVPSSIAEPIAGRVTVQYERSEPGDVIVDFAAAESQLVSVRVNGMPVHPRVTAEHVVIDDALMTPSQNVVEFEFVADAAALNRQADFLYSLFVPARARLTFPCFDQPDLKARFTLALDVPAGWSAVSNAAIATDEESGDRRRLSFLDTELLPTYLFAFVAGQMTVAEGTRNGRRFRVWHREHDFDLVDRNLGPILDLHATALTWLEDYTGIAYPFSKFDIVLVPSFQFSGMEHPGAILYNASRLLLDSSASSHDLLTRASLIAHETAHIWFGDLVTMRWFDDVWLKEVFANFVAEKIVATIFPDQDHELRFYLANYPSAYAVDRTAGANPVRQPLDNLADAGQLYGPIIYLKAPIIFRQLELRLGAERFRDSVRRFLDVHRFANAAWDDLLVCFDATGSAGIRGWSEMWLGQAGRPRVDVSAVADETGDLKGITCTTIDSAGLNRVWPQTIHLTIGYPDRTEDVPIDLRSRDTFVQLSRPRPAYMLGGGDGLGYGRFPLDRDSRSWLLEHAAEVADPLTRGVIWLSLWDELLEGTVPAGRWLTAAVGALRAEAEAQNIERLLTMIGRAFWQFLSVPERDAHAPILEACLNARLTAARSAQERTTWFTAIRQLTVTTSGCEWLERVFWRDDQIPGLPLTETHETALAVELAVRSVAASAEILQAQQRRIVDAERRARLSFLAPAVANEPAIREATFERFREHNERAREAWVLVALQFLNHPLRQLHARRFIRPGLELLPEIKRTGDIFFPARWAEALLGGHSSPVAAAIVRDFLADRSDLSPGLRHVVLTAADPLFRAGRPPY